MAESDFPAAPFVRNGGGKWSFKGIERRVRGLETWQVIGLGALGIAVADHMIAPKGMSFVSKIYDKVLGHGHRLPPLPPPPIPASATASLPPAVATAVAKGYFAGANAQAGWNRGMSPYGGWARNAPAGPWHYAHAAPGSSWEEAMNNGYPWE